MENVERLIPCFDERKQRYFIKDIVTNEIRITPKEGYKNKTNAINYLNMLRKQHGLLNYTEEYYQQCLF